MPVDFSNTPNDSILNQPSDSPMFGSTPIWERNRKRKLGGGSKAASAEPVVRHERAPVRHEAATAAPQRPVFAERPIAQRATPAAASGSALNEPIVRNPAFESSAPRTAAKRTPSPKGKSGASPIAIAAGLAVVVGLGAAGFYAMQPRSDGGVAELTPGSTASAPTATPTTVAANTTAPTPGMTTPAATTPAAAPAPTQVASVEPAPARRAATPVRRAAPAPAAMSADQASADVSATEAASSMDTIDYGVDASATAPMTPAPAAPAATAPAPAASTTPAPATSAPAEVMAPATAPTTEATPAQ